MGFLFIQLKRKEILKNHLGPSLEKHNLLDRKVIIWDHNRTMVGRARTAKLSDPDAANMFVVRVSLVLWRSFRQRSKVHDEFPNKQLIFTEGCQEGPHIGLNLGEICYINY